MCKGPAVSHSRLNVDSPHAMAGGRRPARRSAVVMNAVAALYWLPSSRCRRKVSCNRMGIKSAVACIQE